MADYCSSPAVLTLAIAGGPTLDLMSDQQGFRVSELDLGYPEVREDADPAADRHGTVDFTRLFGARAVTVSGFLVPSPAGSRQKAWHLVAPFLDPGVRVTLTYQVDADTTPRTMTVRADQVAGPIDDPTMSDLHMGFKAADPLAYDATVQTAIAWVYTGGGGGRQYNLTYPRTYPAGWSGYGYATNNGDLAVYPMLRFYGPMSTISFGEYFADSRPSIQWGFVNSFVISAGDRVDLDCRTRTAYVNGDRNRNVFGQLSWNSTGAWPYLPPGVQTSWSVSASNIAAGSELQIVWQDGYLL
jgi:hypothetical protein